jgi:hypothetical protein
MNILKTYAMKLIGWIFLQMNANMGHWFPSECICMFGWRKNMYKSDANVYERYEVMH